MADSKLSDLTADTAPTSDDLMYLVGDPAGTPVDRKVTVGNLAASAPFSGAYAPVVGGVNGPPRVVRKSADESVTSSTTLQDDNHLTFSIGASEVWVAQVHLFVRAGGENPDIKFAWSAPSGATGRHGYMGISTLTAGVEENVRTQSHGTLSTALTLGVASSAAADHYFPGHLYVVNSTNSGSMTFQWAQATSDGSASTLLAGSSIYAYRIA